jgi:membrane protein DedA with SNARE-associated domain
MDLAGLIDSYGYLAVFFGSFLEGETILALAGLASYRGYLDLYKVITLALFAGFLGDQLYFFLGRFKGKEVLERFPKMQRRAHRFDTMLSRWHAPLIIGIRFMYGFRIVGPILLGMGRVPAWKFMLYNFIGAAIWAPLIAGIGYFFGGAIKAALGHLKRYELWVFGAVLLIGIGFALYHHYREEKLDEEEAPALPPAPVPATAKNQNSYSA